MKLDEAKKILNENGYIIEDFYDAIKHSYRNSPQAKYDSWIDAVISVFVELDYDYYDARNIVESYDKALKYMYENGVGAYKAGYFIEHDLDQGFEKYRKYNLDKNIENFKLEIEKLK